MKTPAALLQALEARGASITARADGALLIEPKGILQDVERQLLRLHKAAVVSLLQEREARTIPGVDWSRVSLHQLDSVLEIATPWSDLPLILAPGCRVAAELRARDQLPSRVWCVCELLDLLLVGVTPEDARRVGEAKLLIDGTVRGARRLDVQP